MAEQIWMGLSAARLFHLRQSNFSMKLTDWSLNTASRLGQLAREEDLELGG
jgi:hypothetical protein